MYVDVKVSEVVFVGYCTDARNSALASDYTFKHGILHPRFSHEPLCLFDNSLRKRHNGEVVEKSDSTFVGMEGS